MTEIRNIGRTIIFALSLFILISGVVTPCYGKRSVSTSSKVKNTKKKSNASNTFATPDFAFPVTVRDNAEVALSEALASGNETNAVKALIQCVAATMRISNDSVATMAARMDSVAGKLSVPYRTVAYSLEAQLYKEMYMQNRWKYNGRNTSLTDIPADPNEWSADIFALKIQELCEKSLAEQGVLRAVGYSNIEPLLDKKNLNADTGKYYPDLYAILSYRALSLLDSFQSVQEEIIPFFKDVSKSDISADVSGMSKKITANLVSAYAPGSAAWCRAVVENARLLPGWERYDSLIRKFKEAQTSEFAGYILDVAGSYMNLTLDSDNERNISEAKNYYNLCKEYTESVPTSPFVNNIKARLADMTVKRTDFSVKTQYTSKEQIEVSGSAVNADSFYLLLYRLPSEKYDIDNKTVANVVEASRLCAYVPVKCKGEVPFRDKFNAFFSPQDYGRYFIVPSMDVAGKSIFPQVAKSKYISLFRVSDLTAVVSGVDDGQNYKIYVGSALDFSPMPGVEVSLIPQGWNANKYKTYKIVTDVNGMAETHIDHNNYINYAIKAVKGKDVNEINSSVGGRRIWDGHRRDVSWFTNLSVYHPGDTVIFALIASELRNGKSSLLPDTHVKVLMRDANYKVVDTLETVTDSFGRASGSFRLPENGLLGIFSLSAEEFGGSGGYFHVADYKSPTFFVEVDSVSNVVSVGDMIRISGYVKTYSGMPVRDADISFNLRYHQPWFLRYVYSEPVNASYAGTSHTGADGRFTIELPTDNLAGTPFANGSYVLYVSATSVAGETQQSEQTLFSVGKNSGLNVYASVPDKINADSGEVAIRVSVTNIIGKNVETDVNYKVTDNRGKVCVEGKFLSPMLKLPVSGLVSGKYTLNLALQSDTAVNSKCDFVLYRTSEKRPPVQTPLWVPVNNFVPKDGDKYVEIPFGSSFADSYIYCEISDSHDFYERKLIRISDENSTLRVDVPEKGNRKFVRLVGLHNLEGVNNVVTVKAPEEFSRLQIKTMSFRDKLVPGKRERWTFSINDTAGLTTGPFPAIATMSDKALNAIVPFAWSSVGFDGRYIYGNPVSAVMTLPGSVYYRFNFNLQERFKCYTVANPYFNTYGQPLYGGNRYGMGNVYYSAAMPTGTLAVVEEMEMDGAVQESRVQKSVARMASPKKESGNGGEESAQDEAVGSDSCNEGGVRFREISCPSAFFMPSLCTDSDGSLDISFDVPDFNTTWQFQLLGYSPEMLSDILKLDAVASKPVMVQMNAPRFLRTNDRTSFCVTLFNNSEETRKIEGVIEIFSVSDGKVIASMRSEAEDVEAGASKVIAMDYAVPSDMNMVGLRAYAVSGDFSDGEQTVVGILPSSSPVIESIPIYIGRGGDFTVKLPEYDKNATVSLTYCDNPVWYALTALPDITVSSDATLLSKVDNLFANAVAAGVARKCPQALEAIEYWVGEGKEEGDSTLVSPLQKNESLKQFALNCTPWVRNAESETLRMSHLAALVDSSTNRARIEILVSELLKAQLPDGGWSWTPGMNSSTWITSSVLLRMAMLKDMDVMPEWSSTLDASMLKAVNYCDAEIEKRYRKYGLSSLGVREMNNYLYVRSFFPEAGNSKTMKSLIAKYLKMVKDDWRSFDIYDMSTAAVLLWKSGYTQEARTILESLRQNAQHSPTRGMYFDNLSAGYNGMGRLITTMQALEAFRAIDPDNDATDELRQWILLSRQSQDWQGNSFIPELVYMILSSGTDWMTESEGTRFVLGGKEILPSRRDRFTGSFTMQLDSESASRQEFAIVRNSSVPAWGGIISQSVCPMKDIEQYPTIDIKVSKAIYVVNEKTGATYLEKQKLKPGMKVRVQLTITTGKDANYVSLHDERPACLEPISQISEYTVQDNRFFYREMRDSAVNFFFSFLPKGTTIVSYDCYVDRTGEFSSGIATVQSLYSPTFTAHSGGDIINVGN